jgi:hypothetical protein
MWHSYCNSEAVRVATFVLAVTSFLEEHLHLLPDDIDAILDAEGRAALVTAIDRDGNDKVSNG